MIEFQYEFARPDLSDLQGVCAVYFASLLHSQIEAGHDVNAITSHNSNPEIIAAKTQQWQEAISDPQSNPPLQAYIAGSGSRILVARLVQPFESHNNRHESHTIIAVGESYCSYGNRPAAVTDVGSCVLESIYIHPDLFRRGVGKELHHALLGDHTSHDNDLQVYEKSSANSFYRSLGYEFVEEPPIEESLAGRQVKIIHMRRPSQD
jgi:GNAT superfamily N-acetyltransferase